MINDFLIINFTGKNDLFGLRTNNNFFTQKFQTNSKNNNETLVSKISDFLSKHSVKIDKNFSIIVNNGPGSFSSLRVSLSVAKGIQISKCAKLYGYKNSDLPKFDLKNIEFLIKNNLVENKLIKPVYIS
jgi:tRNA A37 threonylcarbamoyladenosine modification protein TsaB